MRFWLREPLRAEAGEGDGGGGGTPAALDAASISKLISDGVNAALNGYDKKLQARLAKLGQPSAQQQQAAGDGEGDDDETQQQQPKAKQGVVDPEVAKLRRNQERLQKEIAEERAERAREKEAVKQEKLDAAIRRELSKTQFVDDDAFDAAYAAVARKIKYNDDGQIVGGDDDQPLSKYVDSHLKKLTGLIRPKDVNGAGVTNGGKVVGGTDVDTDRIKPGMKPEEKAAIYAQIAAVRGQQ
jgi:Skp family chaperone for outer membrane proteins